MARMREQCLSAAIARENTLMHRCTSTGIIPSPLNATATSHLVETACDISMGNHAPTHQQRLETLKDLYGYHIEMSSRRNVMIAQFASAMQYAIRLEQSEEMYLQRALYACNLNVQTQCIVSKTATSILHIQSTNNSSVTKHRSTDQTHPVQAINNQPRSLACSVNLPTRAELPSSLPSPFPF